MSIIISAVGLPSSSHPESACSLPAGSREQSEVVRATKILESCSLDDLEEDAAPELLGLPQSHSNESAGQCR